MTDQPRHLSASEVEKLLRHLERVQAVVVGGQALVLWSRLFLDRIPQIADIYSLSSEDIDVYGTVADAKTFAKLLENAELHIPSRWDNSPNAAVVIGTVGTHPVRIDFLRSILGVEHRSVKGNYVTLTKESPDGPINISLLHPLDCLRSRLSNINDLHREGIHSISSAKAALMIVDVFVGQLLEEGQTRKAQAILASLYYIARDRCIDKPAGIKFGLNPIYILQKFRLDTRLDARWRSHQIASAIRRLRDKLRRQGQTPPNTIQE
jgi:hypothetical protein